MLALNLALATGLICVLGFKIQLQCFENNQLVALCLLGFLTLVGSFLVQVNDSNMATVQQH